MHVIAKEMYLFYEASLISKFELPELLVLADILKKTLNTLVYSANSK